MEKIEYQRKTIEFDESSDPKVSIDGEPIEVSLDAEASEFHAGELPYRTFKSVRELAEAVVEQRSKSQSRGDS